MLMEVRMIAFQIEERKINQKEIIFWKDSQIEAINLRLNLRKRKSILIFSMRKIPNRLWNLKGLLNNFFQKPNKQFIEAHYFQPNGKTL